MTIQEARTKAREGGYQPAFKHRESGMRAVIVGLHGFRIIQVNAIFLDPEFWRALGRTLGGITSQCGKAIGNALSSTWRTATLPKP